MPAQGRKNVHGKTGVRFKAAYTKSKYENMLRNVVTQLVVSERVTVTAGVAKDLVKLSDKLVTSAKKGDLHSRRLAAAARWLVASASSEGRLLLLSPRSQRICVRSSQRSIAV